MQRALTSSDAKQPERYARTYVLLGYYLLKAGRIPDIVAFTRKGHELLLRIEESKKLTIALLDGLSLGGGSELALACQAIIATPAGSMAFPEIGIGIYPGLGGMLRMARHVGPALAKYFAFTGAAISAADAQGLGISLKSAPGLERALRTARLMQNAAPWPINSASPAPRSCRPSAATAFSTSPRPI